MTHTRSAAHRHARPPSGWRARALLLAFALSGVAACGGSSDAVTEPDDDGPYGTYALRQVDGGALPVQVHNGPFLDRTNVRFYNKLTLRVTGGEIELEDDGTFSLSLELSGVGDGQPVNTTSEFEASYKLIDGRLTIIANGQKVELGVMDEDGTLTIGMDLMQKGVVNQFTFRR